MNERWDKATGTEVEENKAALRLMRVVVWMFLALLFGTLCFFAGLMIGG